MRRIAPAVILFLVFLLPGIAQAQTCPQPVVMLVAGSNPTCAGQPVTLDAGPGWTTYQWSAGAAATRMITVTPDATMSYSVTTTDANGCEMTSQPLTVVVNNASYVPPAIQGTPADICPLGSGTAWIDTPSPDYATVSWTIQHGTITVGASSHYVSFDADGSALPVVLTVTVADANGCPAQSSITIPIRTISAPAVHSYEADVCPAGVGQAWVDTPASGSWDSIVWTIEHGSLPYGNSSLSTSFTADGSGQPVVLHVTVRDYGHCEAQSSITIPIRTIPTPAVHSYEADVCPTGVGQAWVDTPAAGSWDSIVWTIEHGSLPYGNTSLSTSFTADGSGQPVVLHVAVRDYGHCETQNSITIPIRTISTPAVHSYEADVCPTGVGQAWVDTPAAGSWDSIVWTIEHGSLPYGNSSLSTSFTADGSGLPVVLHVTVRDYGHCEAQNSITIPIRTIPTPAVHSYEANVCPTGVGQAWVDTPAAGSWDSIVWTIEHGSLPYGNTSLSTSFTADGSGLPVVLHVTVRDYGHCEAQNSITIPIRTIPAPAVHTYEGTICPTGPGQVYVDPPAGGSWDSIVWTIEHGSLPYGNTSPTASFTADGSGEPVVLHVTVRDYGHCEAQNSITIPVGTAAAVSIQPDYSTVCVNGYGAATIAPPSPGQSWSWINWTIDHGSVYYGQGTTRVNFQADGSGNPVVVHVSAQTDSSSCPAESSVTLPTRVLAPPVIALGTGSCPTTASVTNASDYVQFQWSADNAEISSSTFESSVTFHAVQNGHVTLTVVARDATGCAATSSVGYDVSGLPDITMSLPGVPYCYGSAATASVPDGGPGVTYQWSMNSGHFLGSSTSPTVTFIPEADTLALTVTATNAEGCSASGTSYILVNRPPLGDFNSVPASVCANGTATISTYANGVSYNWQVIDGDIVSGAGTSAITFRAHNAATVTVRLTKAGQYGCGATYERIIPVTQVAATITPSGPTTFCPGGNVTLTANSGASYLWSNGAATQAITVNAAGNYSVTVTNANGCSAMSQPVNVTVNSGPATPLITADGPTTFCDLGSVGLTAPVASAYLWSNGATTRTTRVSTSGDFTVTVTDANGCSATSAPTSVTVLPRPAPTVTIPSQICSGTTAHASVAETFASYNWSAINATIVGPVNGPAVDFTNTSSSGCVISLTVTDTNGCQSSISRNVTTSPAVVPVINASAHVCTTDTGNANVSPTAGSSWDWSATNATITGTFNGQGQADPHGSQIWYVPLGAGTVTLTVVEHAATGCSGTGTANITVDAPAPTDFTVNATCPGGTGTASSQLVYTFYSWSITNGSFIGNTVNQRNVSFRMSSDPANPSVITLTASNGPGSCVAPVTHTVPVATLAPPTITLFPNSGICPGNSVSASAATSGYDTYHWTISNGTIYSGASSYLINYSANAGAPATLSLTVTRNGCSSSSSVVIPVADTTAQPITAPDSICPTGTFTASVPAGYVNYNWTFTNAQQVSSSGNAVTLRPDGSGQPIQLSISMKTSGFCNVAPSSKTVSIAATAAPQIAFDLPAGFCGGMTGNASVANGPYATYLWSITGGVINGPNNAGTISFSADSSGSTTLAVTVTDGRGDCSSASSAVVPFVNPKPLIDATSLSICSGGNATLSTRVPADSYLWSTGATTPSITVTAPGDYTVTTTKAGCSFTSAPVHISPSTPAVTISANFPSHCPGASSMITAIASGFTGFVRTYTWYATDQLAAISTGRDYYQLIANSPNTRTFYCVVSDERGCSARSNDLTITVFTPTAVITPSGPTTFCAGGSVTLTANAGSSYSWSNGATTQSITVTSSGSYNVYVIDTHGCGKQSASTAVTVNPLPATPAITPSGPTTFCAGGSVTLTAPAGYASYAWSNGGSGQSTTVNTSGSYSVIVSTAAGCSATSAATTVVANARPATPVITASGPTTFCAGGNVTLSAPAGYTYSWSNGASTQSISVTQSGNYSVTVTDANGCTAASAPAQVVVNDAPDATVTVTGSRILCSGASVHLAAPAGMASYLWSNGATTSAIDPYTPGSYSVTVTNASGCSSTSTPVDVTSDPASVTIQADRNTVCAGSSLHITSAVTNGSALSYQWYTFGGIAIAGATSPQLDVTPSSNTYYFLRVADANGCTIQSNSWIVTSSQADATIAASGPTTFCAGGSVTLTAPAGNTYLWSNNATTQSITVGTSGTYSVTVTNANGCTASASTTVTVNPVPEVTFSTPATICGTSESVQEVQPLGTGLTYNWSISNGAITQNAGHRVYFIANVGASQVVLTVTISDGNNCSNSGSITLPVHTPPAATITPSGSTAICSGGNVTLNAPAGMSSYLWSSGETTQSITVSTPNSYSVTVRDADFCSAQSTPVVVTIRSGPTATVSGGGAICPGGSATITAALTGTAPWSVTWSDNVTQTIDSGSTATRSVTPGSAMTYTVTSLTDANCTGTSSGSAAVTIKTLPTATVSGGGAICPGGSATITAALTGTAPWSVTWSDNVTQTINSGTTASRSVNPASATTYTVISLTDATCTGTSSGSAAVTIKTLPTATVSGGGAICPGGSATITAALTGTAPWSVTWSDNVTQTINSGTTASRSVNPASATTYTVTSISDANCSGTSSGSAAVTIKALPTATVSGGGAICPGGSVTITAALTGTAPWNVRWSDNVTQTINSGTTASRSVNPASATTYTVTSITDANCTGTSNGSAAVTIKTTPTATVSGGGAICPGGSATITAALTGTAPWNVTWSDNVTQTISSGTTASRSVSPVANTTYTVLSITDANCTGTASGSASVTIKTLPTATVSGGGGPFCPGGSATITAALTGTAPWSVIWSDNVTQTINSGTTASRTVSPSATTVYTVSSVSDASGCSVPGNGSATVSVKTLPTATVSGGGAICPGASATITAALTGIAPWSVTWSDNTTQSINSGTTATRNVSPAATTTYTVTSVTDASGCAAVAGSGSATVSRSVAASITTQPANKSTTINTNVTISVVAAGTSPISYQWFKSNGTIVTGATSSSYTTSFPAKGNYQFYVEVWNACNTTHVKSHNVTVTVN